MAFADFSLLKKCMVSRLGYQRQIPRYAILKILEWVTHRLEFLGVRLPSCRYFFIVNFFAEPPHCFDDVPDLIFRK